VDELMIFDALDDGVVTEVIRPAAVVPETAARNILVEMAVRDVRSGGHWHTEPSLWRRYDRPWSGSEPGPALLLGSLQVAYGVPTRYEITIYRVTITQEGTDHGFDVLSLTDEALGFGDLTLATCPRASLASPPKPFRMR
jgi:hypothetical protein